MTSNSNDDEGQQIVRIQRVVLPRYELQYFDGEVALSHACSIKKTNVFAVPSDFQEPVGQEVVLDLGAEKVTLTVTLLFRIIQKSETYTVFDWWARRSTDSDLLQLWIEELEREQK